MLDRSPVILWYRLTIPWESWLTVVIRASPTAATIRAYSTRSCPCSSRINLMTSAFIVPLSVTSASLSGGAFRRVRFRLVQRAHEQPAHANSKPLPTRIQGLGFQRGGAPVQARHQLQIP